MAALGPTMGAAGLAQLRLSQASVLIYADRAGIYDMASVVAEVAPRIPELIDVISLSEVGMLYGSPVQPRYSVPRRPPR